MLINAFVDVVNDLDIVEDEFYRSLEDVCVQKKKNLSPLTLKYQFLRYFQNSQNDLSNVIKAR